VSGFSTFFLKNFRVKILKEKEINAGRLCGPDLRDPIPHQLKLLDEESFPSRALRLLTSVSALLFLPFSPLFYRKNNRPGIGSTGIKP
jgi:hypothetical protein